MQKTLDRNSIAGIRNSIDAIETKLFDAVVNGGIPVAATEDDVTELLAIHDRLIEADRNNEFDWMRDVPGSEDIHYLIESLLSRWLFLTDRAEAVNPDTESAFPTSGAAERLRKERVEIRAALNPSYVLSGKMLDIRDAALEEYRRGETIEGVVD